MSKVTAKELDLMKAIDASEYGDSLTDDVWTFSVTCQFDNEKSAAALIGSLEKKGLVTTRGIGDLNNADGSTIGFTEEGAKVYIDLVGKENVQHYIDQ